MSIEQIVKAESTSAASERAMDAIVAELRELRNASLAARQRSGNPLKLPSRRALTAIVEGFSTVLFPNRLGSRQLAHESVDYYVGHTLDETCRDLVEQVVMELQFSGGQIDHREEWDARAQELVREFAFGACRTFAGCSKQSILAAF